MLGANCAASAALLLLRRQRPECMPQDAPQLAGKQAQDGATPPPLPLSTPPPLAPLELCRSTPAAAAAVPLLPAATAAAVAAVGDAALSARLATLVRRLAARLVSTESGNPLGAALTVVLLSRGRERRRRSGDRYLLSSASRLATWRSRSCGSNKRKRMHITQAQHHKLHNHPLSELVLLQQHPEPSTTAAGLLEHDCCC
jgi:hypothetical protein